MYNCNICYRNLKGVRTSYRNNKIYCEDCFKNETTKCRKCNVKYYKDQMESFCTDCRYYLYKKEQYNENHYSYICKICINEKYYIKAPQGKIYIIPLSKLFKWDETSFGVKDYIIPYYKDNGNHTAKVVNNKNKLIQCFKEEKEKDTKEEDTKEKEKDTKEEDTKEKEKDKKEKDTKEKEEEDTKEKEEEDTKEKEKDTKEEDNKEVCLKCTNNIKCTKIGEYFLCDKCYNDKYYVQYSWGKLVVVPLGYHTIKYEYSYTLKNEDTLKRCIILKKIIDNDTEECWINEIEYFKDGNILDFSSYKICYKSCYKYIEDKQEEDIIKEKEEQKNTKKDYNNLLDDLKNEKYNLMEELNILKECYDLQMANNQLKMDIEKYRKNINL